MKNDYFTLEFNEEQQEFHHNPQNSKYAPSTNGWETIIEECNDINYRIFESYINWVNRDENKYFTVSELRAKHIELNLFINRLNEYNLEIK